MTVPIDPIDKTNSPDIEELSTEKLNVKKSSQGVTLVPQPSDDPQDPLVSDRVCGTGSID